MATKITIFSFATFAIFFRQAIILSKELNLDIEWSVIIPSGSFRNYFDDVVPKNKIFYIYENFDGTPPVENELYKSFSQKFNLNVVMSTDKNGYRNELKDFQFDWASKLVNIYLKIIQNTLPNYILFPTIETSEGSLLAAICNELSVPIMHAVHMRTLGNSFFSTDQIDTFPNYFGAVDDVSIKKAKEIIDAFSMGLTLPVKYPQYSLPKKVAVYKLPPIYVRAINSIKYRLLYEKWFRTEDGLVSRIKRKFVRPLYAYRKWKYKTFQEPKFDIISTADELIDEYVLYAAQMTPEASINSIAPYFVDQDRVIDIIRYNLPSRYKLLFKEHPDMAGQRDSAFYRKLSRVVGVSLVSSRISTALIAAKAKLITTVTGTIALESYLSDRPCLMFGRTFFSHLVESIEDGFNVKEIDNLIKNYAPPSYDEKVENIARLYNISFPFVLFDPLACPHTLQHENISNFLFAILRHISRLKSNESISSSMEI